MAESSQLLRVVMLLTMYFLLFQRISSALPPTPAGTLCVPRERDALLDFKAGLTDPSNLLSSWRGVECCRWTGVVCSNRTGHVVTLQVKSDWAIRGEIRPSLLTLRHLKQLDLSYNDFGLKHIPTFIGALGRGRLMHLDLSLSNFRGRIPPHLGNLSDLVSLQLNGMRYAYSRDLAWVSRLRKLQVLSMLHIDLSRAVDWTHAINMLPNL
uniref:Leucine-rich repeat-containing N-terminal plant-type domain-containing protein n=2 Tax=Triticum urartu TaxID=4572 RepID=A0A8R7UPP5_TRIUA